MSRYTNPVPQYPVANGKLFFYESEQNVLKSTFADQPQTILNTNPVLLDSAGRTPNIYYTGTARVVLTDCNSLQVWERDPVGGENAFADFGQWLSYITYDVNDIVEVSNNFYLSKTIANQGNDPSVTPGSNANWTLINFLGLFNTSTTYSVGSIVNTSNGKIWASVVNSNLNNDPITDVDGDYWTSSVSVPIRKTTEGLILSSEIFATGIIIETSGYAASADGGAGSWKQNGFVGQTASQSPLQLNAALLNDAAGNQWALIINGPVSAVALGPGATAAVASVSTFGTAANADVTVSTTDITTGRLIKQGDTASFVKVATSPVVGSLLVGRTASFSSALSEMQVSAASSLTLALNNNSSQDNLVFGLYNSGVLVGGLGNDTVDLTFFTGTSERMRINAAGDVVVGATAALAADSVTMGAGFTVVRRTSNIASRFVRDGTDGDVLAFDKVGTRVGSVSVTASATSYNTSSDERLKENITYSLSASNDIDAIQIRQFDWRVDNSHQKYGVVTQELVNVVPDAVYIPADPDEMQSVDYSKLVPMLIKEVQELRARVALLEV